MSASAAALEDVFEEVESRIPGRVTIPSGPGTRSRTYVCNAERHCIDVFEDDDDLLFSFGELGNGAGQFNDPGDVAVVFLRPRAGTPGSTLPSGQFVVVADRGNHRLQLFALDGKLITTIDPWLGRMRRVDLDDRSGWPFFRVNPLPQMVLPSVLEWRAPFLTVTGGDGSVVVVDLELALLPDFQTWLNTTPSVVVRDALDASLRPSTHDHIPEMDLWAVDSRVRSDLRLVRNTWA
jgi:hypothetical protein